MWAAEYGYKMDKKTCANAVKEGHLEVLKWARENRCEWAEETKQLAALKEYTDTIIGHIHPN